MAGPDGRARLLHESSGDDVSRWNGRQRLPPLAIVHQPVGMPPADPPAAADMGGGLAASCIGLMREIAASATLAAATLTGGVARPERKNATFAATSAQFSPLYWFPIQLMSIMTTARPSPTRSSALQAPAST